MNQDQEIESSIWEVAMIGPTANPLMIVFVTTVFFVGIGYLSYFFGKMDAHSSR